jgi:hypothetical protein
MSQRYVGVIQGKDGHMKRMRTIVAAVLIVGNGPALPGPRWR